ncbi:MAG: DUF4383 domain-containing protein [Actinobacteria bacterium]|nr:DUF4383 domain-containing protein [Actinomycetota bacterium]
MATTPTHTTDKHPAQYVALAIGAVYTLVGLVGFAVTGFDGFASPEGSSLLGFEINPLHNIVHLIIGGAGLALWSRLDGTRMYGWLLAVGYGLTFVYGLLVTGTESQANFLALNAADNWLLHLPSAIVGLAIALWVNKDMRNTTGTTTRTGRTTSV